MADIELVIKISEDSYKATCKGLMLPLDVINAIKSGLSHREIRNEGMTNELKFLTSKSLTHFQKLIELKPNQK